MSAVLSVAVESGPPVGTGIVIAAVFVSIVTLALTLSARKRRHLSELLEYAARADWHPVSDPSGLPPMVVDALLSKRSKLFRRFHTMPLWVSWHQWTEISRGGTYNASTRRWENRTSSRTYDLTRYFAALPGTFPDMAIERRPRPDPSGSRPFERRFLVRTGDLVSTSDLITTVDLVRTGNPLSTGDPGLPRDEACPHVPHRLAQALLAQSVPPFTIINNVLIVRFDDRPTRANLSMRADEVRRLTLLLTPSKQTRG